MNEPKIVCPQCRQPMTEICYPRDCMLNRDQWESQIAGNYFCTCHSNGRGKDPYAYFWKSELTELSPPSPAVSALTEERDRLKNIPEPTKEAFAKMSREEIEQDALALWALKEMWARAANSNELVKLQERAELAEQRVQSMREALTEQAAKAICRYCSLGMPVNFKVVFEGTQPNYYHVFRHEEDWWRKVGMSEWYVSHEPGMTLNDVCRASKVRAALSAPEGSGAQSPKSYEMLKGERKVSLELEEEMPLSHEINQDGSKKS